MYFRINAASLSAGDAVANTHGIPGHYLRNRSTSSAVQGYRNAFNELNNNATTSAAVNNFNFYTLGQNSNGTAGGNAEQTAMASIGSSLNGTEATNFYNRLRTYMTAVGVP